MTRTPVFFVDKTNDKITSYCVGDLWVYHYHEALVAVHSLREFYALDPHQDLNAMIADRLTPGILSYTEDDLKTIVQDIDSDSQPVYLGALELENATLRLVAHQVQTLIDSALFQS